MTPLGIALLALGIIVIIASFFVPDKGDREDKKDIEKKQEQIRKMMDTELDGMKLRVNEATNETVEMSMEKSERALEKITNDKIMAVSEYATTVMEEIDRNHKEVMFLYDMLNDKQVDIKNTVRHAEATAKEVTEAAKTASESAVYATNVANQATETASKVSEQVNAIPTYNIQEEPLQQTIQPVQTMAPIPQQMTQETQRQTSVEGFTFDRDAMMPTGSVFGMMASMEDLGTEVEVAPILPSVPKIEEPVKEEEKELTEFEILERNTSFNNVSNNNQRILKMNAEGIPVVDIARQLSLGVGEVQLVIDLFK